MTSQSTKEVNSRHPIVNHRGPSPDNTALLPYQVWKIAHRVFAVSTLKTCKYYHAINLRETHLPTPATHVPFSPNLTTISIAPSKSKDVTHQPIPLKLRNRIPYQIRRILIPNPRTPKIVCHESNRTSPKLVHSRPARARPPVHGKEVVGVASKLLDEGAVGDYRGAAGGFVHEGAVAAVVGALGEGAFDGRGGVGGYCWCVEDFDGFAAGEGDFSEGLDGVVVAVRAGAEVVWE